jgi:hypothetical protein
MFLDLTSSLKQIFVSPNYTRDINWAIVGKD